MTKTNYVAADDFQRQFPHTHAAMTKLLTAMAKVQKDRGRTTWLGRDKGVDAFKAFLESTKNLCIAMYLDGVIKGEMDSEDIRKEILSKISLCAYIYPNWTDAYAFSREFFIESPKIARDAISEFTRAIMLSR